MSTKPILLIAIALFALPLASAVSLNDSILNATSLPLQINVTAPIYFTELQVNESWIYFEDLRASEAATESITFNLTTAGDYLGSDLPYFSSSSTSSKTLTSGIYEVNLTSATFTTQTGTAVCRFKSIKVNGEPTTSYSCDAGVVTLAPVLSIVPGANTIAIDQNYVNATSSTLMKNGLAVILAVVILIILIAPFGNGIPNLTMGQWIMYFIMALIELILIIILIEQIFAAV